MNAKRSRKEFETDLRAQQSPYVVYGTPLPPIDPDVRDDGSYVPLWKQEVTDERGRKRLHGAFTGGFSAGYFNTVGSKEGWTPAAFVSSRSNRLKDAPKASQQRPEDFMDDEDLADAAEAQRLETSGSFAGIGSPADDAFRRDSIIDILKTRGETMGVKLLRKMGWKDGQGVGPKIRRKARLDVESDLPGAEENHLFAPENSKMISFSKKSDLRGIGYESGPHLLEPGSDSVDLFSIKKEQQDVPTFGTTPASAKKAKKPALKGGFGVGILNDTGSDDEDPYSMGPRILYSRIVVDKKKKKAENTRPAAGAANPLLKAKPIFISKRSASAQVNAGFRKCHDGRLPLDGFMLSSDPGASSIINQDGWYAAPQIPENWKSAKIPSDVADAQSYQSAAEAARASKLNPASRASLLGEAQLPGKSVFDFISSKSRDRIANASGKDNLPAGLGEAGPKAYALSDDQRQQDLWHIIPKLDKSIALQALGRGVGGWMPYAEDRKKRSRYQEFLEIRAGIRQGLPSRDACMESGEWLKELQEFADAAQIFKPISGMMASRFTSSSIQPKSVSNTLSGTVELLSSSSSSKAMSASDQAAKIGMYGPLTRSIQPFYPTRLLCKRFNVKPPSDVQPDTGQQNEVQELIPKSAVDKIMNEIGGHRGYP
ncbi:MAG: hypothetical protein M1829_003915 [Trizodia sp. TS-e1964]|nr:MAG: hypothetical protein M1829_003915 [Trizodia sp. TS-e1964]